MTPLNNGYFIVSTLSVVGLFIATQGDAGRRLVAVLLLRAASVSRTGIAFVYITQYYTSGAWRPVQEIADASRTGPATNIIIGTAVGLETTAATALTIGLALVASFVHRLGGRRHAGVTGFSTRRLRHRRRHDGHAHVRRLRPLDGHLRADHR